MKLNAPSGTNEVLPENNQRASSARSVARELAATLSLCLMFVGMSAICRAVWPLRKDISYAVTLLAFAGWMGLLFKFRVLYRSLPLPKSPRIWVGGFLIDFLAFWFFMVVWTAWLHDWEITISSAGACGVGAVVFAILKLWREDRKSLPSAEGV